MWPSFDPPLTAAEKTAIAALSTIALFAGYICGRVALGL